MVLKHPRESGAVSPGEIIAELHTGYSAANILAMLVASKECAVAVATLQARGSSPGLQDDALEIPRRVQGSQRQNYTVVHSNKARRHGTDTDYQYTHKP